MENQGANGESLSTKMAKEKVSGQTRNIQQMNNPAGMKNLKETRNTGRIADGTAYLRNNQNGKNQ